MHVFDKFADQFARLPMFFMAFHGQESIDKVINVRTQFFPNQFHRTLPSSSRQWVMLSPSIIFNM